jgi:hypothetical protein
MVVAIGRPCWLTDEQGQRSLVGTWVGGSSRCGGSSHAREQVLLES